MTASRLFAQIGRTALIAWYFGRLLLIFSAGLSASCGMHPVFAEVETKAGVHERKVVLDEDFSGIAEVVVRERIEVRLKALLGAGYSWSLESPIGATVRYIGTTIEVETSHAGVGGQLNTQVFSFEAIEAGTAALRFVYRQPWLKTTESDRRLVIVITVRDT
jgi:predicted secreted protein